MDCEKFESTILDALYGELDEVTSAAQARHAAGCASCAAQLAKYKTTRKLVAFPLEEAPAGLEARIMAAVDALPLPSAALPGGGASAALSGGGDAAASTRAVGATSPLAEPPGRRPTNRVIAFLARPQFAMAAAFLLV